MFGKVCVDEYREKWDQIWLPHGVTVIVKVCSGEWCSLIREGAAQGWQVKKEQCLVKEAPARAV
jgi:SH3-like domain-containing protein